MKQVTRASEIDTILKTISTQLPDGVGATLKAYISQLEANQKIVQPDTIPWNPDNPPMWSHARREKRAQQRRERASRKRNNYQSIKPL